MTSFVLKNYIITHLCNTYKHYIIFLPLFFPTQEPYEAGNAVGPPECQACGSTC